ncbi:hypothetical protein [Pedobacter sp. SYSU D00535]|uniref:hypothetical protein n=1 Tax=Pedobacter sp. SYSU D00535 TaxID=2810308 RepID=UPI001A971106|nr:hypothetical protein [Pedobacter sp. SYSU D00535]
MQKERLKWFKLFIPVILIAAAASNFKTPALFRANHCETQVDKVASEEPKQAECVQINIKKCVVRLREIKSKPFQGVFHELGERASAAIKYLRHSFRALFIAPNTRLQLLLYPFHSHW